jgi:hypothetical protein
VAARVEPSATSWVACCAAAAERIPRLVGCLTTPAPPPTPGNCPRPGIPAR